MTQNPTGAVVLGTPAKKKFPVVINLRGPQGPAGKPGTSLAGIPGPAGTASGAVTITAAEDIPAFAVVLSTGRVANSDNPSQGFGKVIGIAPAPIANGFSGEVLQAGEIQNPGWTWNIGDVLFLNGTVISAIAPASGFGQGIGTAKNSTTIIIDLREPVLF